MTQIYLVTDVRKLNKFLDEEIGTEYENSYEDQRAMMLFKGDVTVWDLTETEHQKIRKFITDNNLWSE